MRTSDGGTKLARLEWGRLIARATPRATSDIRAWLTIDAWDVTRTVKRRGVAAAKVAFIAPREGYFQKTEMCVGRQVFES